MVATRRWRGDAPAVAQQVRVTPASVAVGNVFELTVNNKTVSYTAAAATVADVVAGLAAAWTAATFEEMLEAVASNQTTYLRLTAAAPGVPFEVSATAAGGTATLTAVTTVASRGPNHYDDPNNWTGLLVPDTGDTAVWDATNVDCLYGLDQNSGAAADASFTIAISGSPTGGTFTLSFDGYTTAGIAYNASAATVKAAFEALPSVGAGNTSASGGPLPGSNVTITFDGAVFKNRNLPSVIGDGSLLTGGSITPPQAELTISNTAAVIGVTLAAIIVTMGYTGTIGLPVQNTSSNSSPYWEYRTTSLTVGATTVTIGQGDGSGSGRIKIDNGTVQTTLYVLNSGQRLETAVPAIVWKGTHASNVLSANKGDFGAAIYEGELATLATTNIGYTTNVAGDVTAQFGDGCTLTTLNISGGVTTIASGTTLIRQTDGDLTITAGAHAAINSDGGNVYYMSTGTLTAGKAGSGAAFDFSRDMRARTVTSMTVEAGSSLVDSFRTVTWTNPILFNRCGVQDLTKVDLGTHVTLAVAAGP